MIDGNSNVNINHIVTIFSDHCIAISTDRVPSNTKNR